MRQAVIDEAARALRGVSFPESTRLSPSMPPVIDDAIDFPPFGELRYRAIGSPALPPIAVLGGISADRRCDHWWSAIIGPAGALHPGAFRLVSIDWLDAPADGPVPAISDQADALLAALEACGHDHFAAIVGSSFGAMVALDFAARHRERINRVVAISGAHRSTPAATARRVIQRAIIRAAEALGEGERGLALARALALTTYRPDALFDARFHDPDPAVVIERLESYFEYNGRRFASGFSTARYLALSEAMDRHLVDPRAIRCPVELIGAASDTLVPLAQLRSLAGAIGMKARLHVIESPYGHDAFLKSSEEINRLLGRLLARVPHRATDGTLRVPGEVGHGA